MFLTFDLYWSLQGVRFKKKMKKSSKAFTLIELLVVISIIGILATLLVANYNGARQRARDAQRKADLRNIQSALRMYYNDKSKYPPQSSEGLIKACGSGGNEDCPWGNPFTSNGVTYMSLLPKDPSPNGSYQYTSTDGQDYTLKACLENKADDKCDLTDTSCSTIGCTYKVKP